MRKALANAKTEFNFFENCIWNFGSSCEKDCRHQMERGETKQKAEKVIFTYEKPRQMQSMYMMYLLTGLEQKTIQRPLMQTVPLFYGKTQKTLILFMYPHRETDRRSNLIRCHQKCSTNAST